MSRMDCNKVKTHPWQRGTGFFFCRDSNRTVLVNIRSAGLPLLFIKCIDRKCVGISSSNEESINALPSLSSAVHLLFYRRRAAADDAPPLSLTIAVIWSVRLSLQQRPSRRRPFLCFSIFRRRERDGTKTAIQHEAPFVQLVKCMLVDDRTREIQDPMSWAWVLM